MNQESKELLAQIERALAVDAEAAIKERGAQAAMTLHRLLAATPGLPLAPPIAPVSSLGQQVQQMRNAPQSVVLDALIAKLASYLPKDEVETAASEGMKVPFVPIPASLRGTGKGESS